MAGDDDEEWLPPPGAARRLRLKPKSLQEYRVTGGGPKFYKLGPGRNARVVYKRMDLTESVEKHGFPIHLGVQKRLGLRVIRALSWIVKAGEPE